MPYTIAVVSPPGYVHCRVFDEIALGLQGGFAELGMDVPIVSYTGQEIKGKPIVLGANVLPAFPTLRLPPRSIVFNLEQVGADSDWMGAEYLTLLRTHEVWDYSHENIERLALHGVCNARYCGIGYAPGLRRIAPAEEDVDVLFYGSIFGRRVPILQTIEATGVRVQKLFGVYGAQRDAWIARSKIVLNVHAYTTQTFEIARVSYLWANQKCVLSETSTGIPPSMLSAMDPLLADADELPWLCNMLLADAKSRRELAQDTFASFTHLRQSDYLQPLLTPLAQSMGR